MAASKTLMRSCLLLAVAANAGCVTIRQTDPPTTAEEMLLISTAVDRAVSKLKLPDVPAGSRVFVDATNVDFDANGTVTILPKYTVAAVRDQLLRLGYKLVADRKEGDYIVELRNGAQAIDDKKIIIGIPNTTIPVPLTGPVTVPELALFKYQRQHGVSKLGLVAYGQNGAMAYSTGSQFGDSEQKHWSVLFVISFTSHDILPEDVR
jgi:hypothetical protein